MYDAMKGANTTTHLNYFMYIVVNAKGSSFQAYMKGEVILIDLCINHIMAVGIIA